MQEPFELTATAQEKMDHGAPESGGNKRQHNSNTSDSDKDNGATIVENQLALIFSMPTQGPWRKVEKKKGGKF